MSGDLVRCPQGHVFDRTQQDVCPLCGEGVAKPLPPHSMSETGAPSGDEHSRTLKKSSNFGNLTRPTLLLGSGTASLALIGLAVFLLWPAQKPGPVPPHRDDEKTDRTETAASDKKTTAGGATQSGTKGAADDGKKEPTVTDGAKTDPSSAPAPKPEPQKQAVLEPPPKPETPQGQDGTVSDLRDPLALALEKKYEFSPLARELLATSRGCFASGRREYALAKSWMTSDAAKANPATLYWYALMLEKGNGVPQDYAAALGMLTTSAEAGFYYSQYRLAEIYLKSIYPSVPADPAKGKLWLVKAARESRPEALRLAAETGLKADDFSPNVELLDRALAQSFQDTFKVASSLLNENTTSGIFWTGTLTFYGQGTKRDEQQGRDLIVRAARLYAWQALVDLANWSANGYETPKNPVEAAALAYIARENIAQPNEAEIVDKAIAPLTQALTNEQYQDLGILLKGITSLPARSN